MPTSDPPAFNAGQAPYESAFQISFVSGMGLLFVRVKVDPDAVNDYESIAETISLVHHGRVDCAFILSLR